MLIKTPDLIEAMIELACSRRWLQTTIHIIEFSQHVIQGLWIKDSSLLQVRTSTGCASDLARCRLGIYGALTITLHTGVAPIAHAFFPHAARRDSKLSVDDAYALVWVTHKASFLYLSGKSFVWSS